MASNPERALEAPHVCNAPICGVCGATPPPFSEREKGIRDAARQAERERIADARLDGWCDCELDETYPGSGEGQIAKCAVCEFIERVVQP